MAELPDDGESAGVDAERERIRAHYRAEVARAGQVAAEARDAELRLVRQAAAARRRAFA